MENSTTTISREELEELQEAFNKIGMRKSKYNVIVLLDVRLQEQNIAFLKICVPGFFLKNNDWLEFLGELDFEFFDSFFAENNLG